MANPPAKGTLNGRAGITFVVVATVVVVAAFVGAALTQQRSTLSDAAAIAVITGAAVGIERTIEAGWSAVAVFKNSWWPLSEVAVRINELADDVTNTVKEQFAAAKKYADEAVADKNLAKEKADALKIQLTNAETQLDNLLTLAHDDQRLKLIAASGKETVDSILREYDDPKLKGFAQAAGDSIDTLDALLGTFQDNPGKRLISLYVGALLGLIVVFVVGLDVFKAAAGLDLDRGPFQNLSWLHGLHFGVAFTGIIIGLGSGPTHEIIKIIQEFKQGLQGGSITPPGTQGPAQPQSLLPARQR